MPPHARLGKNMHSIRLARSVARVVVPDLRKITVETIQIRLLQHEKSAKDSNVSKRNYCLLRGYKTSRPCYS